MRNNTSATLCLIIFTLCLLSPRLSAIQHNDIVPKSDIWFAQPAQPANILDEALPIGNGRLVAMVFGGEQQERLQLQGVKARGGFELDINWQQGQLVNATLHSKHGQTCQLRHQGKAKKFNLYHNNKK